MDGGFDQPGTHRVHPYALGGQLVGETQREGVDRTLGGGVIHVLPRRAEPGRHRRDVDHAAARVGAHVGHRLPGDLDGAQDVDLEHPPDPLGGQIGERCRGRNDPGVVDQVERPRRQRGQLGEKLGHLRGIGDIRADDMRLGALGADLLGHRFGAVPVTAVVDHDALPAAGGGEAAGCRPDAGAAAGDQQQPAHDSSRVTISVTSRERPGLAAIFSSSACIMPRRVSS